MVNKNRLRKSNRNCFEVEGRWTVPDEISLPVLDAQLDYLMAICF